MSASSGRYEVYLAPEFQARMASLAVAADTDQRAERLQAEAVRTVRRLGKGKENGHHPLTDRSAEGRGDLRDCTVSEFRSDPNGQLDCRLVWRQLPQRVPGGPAVRELVHVGQRHEVPDAYQRTLQILEREPTRQVGENEAFGNPAYVGDQSRETRKVALEAQRTIALTRLGVVPMAKSRPLGEAEFGGRGAGRQQVSKSLSRDPDSSRQ